MRTYLLQNHDSNGDGKISRAEVANVTILYLSGKGIANLSGLEHFTNLETLDISNNQITEVNALQWPKLKEIVATNNRLSSLDLSSATNLTTARIAEGNPSLTSIKVATQEKADSFNVSDRTNKYTFSGLVEGYISFVEPSLERYALSIVDHNRDGKVTPSEASSYTGIFVASNLGISRLDDLRYFIKITELQANANNITNVSLEGFYNLKVIQLGNNQISQISLRNLPMLTSLKLNGNRFTSFTLNDIVSLTELGLSDNPLTSLSIDGLVRLQGLSLLNTELSGTLDLSKLANLSSEQVQIKQKITAQNQHGYPVQINSNPNLTEIITSSSALASAMNTKEETSAYRDIAGNAIPVVVEIRDTRLKQMLSRALTTPPVSTKTSFTQQELAKITSLTIDQYVTDLTGLEYCTELQTLTCSAKVTSVDVSTFTKLTSLTLNQSTTITSVNIGRLPSLKTLNFTLPNVQNLDLTESPYIENVVLNQAVKAKCIKVATQALADKYNTANARFFPQDKYKFKVSCE